MHHIGPRLSVFFLTASSFTLICDAQTGSETLLASQYNPWHPQQWSPLSPSDEYVMNTTNMWFWFCNPSAFVCKLNIMEKNKNACVCSWFCHDMTLPNVWYCFLYKKKTKYTTVDALRLCYKSVFLLDNILYLWTLSHCLFGCCIDYLEAWLDVN